MFELNLSETQVKQRRVNVTAMRLQRKEFHVRSQRLVSSTFV